MLENMADQFLKVMNKTRLPQGDFPNLKRFVEIAGSYEFAKFRKLDEKLLATADAALATHIPNLLRQLGDGALRSGKRSFARQNGKTRAQNIV